MSRTINGKQFNQVLKELKEPFNLKWFNYENFEYVPVVQVQERLDRICGLNWSFNLTDKPHLVDISQENNKANIVCSGCLSLYDDEGKLVSQRSNAGGTEVIYIKKDKKNQPITPQVKKLEYDFKSAAQKCFSKCAEMFGIGRYISLQSSIDKAKSNKNTTTSNNTQSIKLQLKSKSKSSSKNIKFKVSDVKGREGSLVIWNNSDVLKDAIKMKHLNNKPIGTVIETICTERNYHGELQFHCQDIVA